MCSSKKHANRGLSMDGRRSPGCRSGCAWNSPMAGSPGTHRQYAGGFARRSGGAGRPAALGPTARSVARRRARAQHPGSAGNRQAASAADPGRGADKSRAGLETSFTARAANRSRGGRKGRGNGTQRNETSSGDAISSSSRAAFLRMPCFSIRYINALRLMSRYLAA